MKTVVINKLRLKNFKGVKDLTIEPNGQSISIFGKNASGKTTIQDAFFGFSLEKTPKTGHTFRSRLLTHQGKKSTTLKQKSKHGLMLTVKPSH